MGSKKKWLRRKLFESFQQEEEVQVQPEPAPLESVVEKVRSKVLPRGRAPKKSKK